MQLKRPTHFTNNVNTIVENWLGFVVNPHTFIVKPACIRLITCVWTYPHLVQ